MCRSSRGRVQHELSATDVTRKLVSQSQPQPPVCPICMAALEYAMMFSKADFEKAEVRFSQGALGESRSC